MKSEKNKENNDLKFDLTTVQYASITVTQINKDVMSSQRQGVSDTTQKEIWFVSDEGSDANNCKTVSTPCKNLQTVLDRASDKADIYSTSDTLFLDLANDTIWYKMGSWIGHLTASCCLINSSLSYTLRSIDGTNVDILCSSKYYLQLILLH